MEQEYFVIYYQGVKDAPYCRVAYDKINFNDEFAPNKELFKNIMVDESLGLIYNGYSFMERWEDATLFKTKEDALNVILNNVMPNVPKDKLQIMNIKIKGDIVYGN